MVIITLLEKKNVSNNKVLERDYSWQAALF